MISDLLYQFYVCLDEERKPKEEPEVKREGSESPVAPKVEAFSSESEKASASSESSSSSSSSDSDTTSSEDESEAKSESKSDEEKARVPESPDESEK